MSHARTLGVIPARLASTRLPRKVLRPLLGRPMLSLAQDRQLPGVTLQRFPRPAG